MGYKNVLVEKRGKVGIITLNRPDVFNALNSKMLGELLDILQQFKDDTEVNAIVIKGAGSVFCSGHDMVELKDKTLLDKRRTFEKSVLVLQIIATMGKPVIAAVQRHAGAMGLALAGGCDIVIASDDAEFVTPGVGIGFGCITPAAAMYRSVSRKKLFELLATGEPIDTREAERIGLVNRVVPREKLDAAAMELADKIASKAPLAVQFSKEAFYNMADMPHNQAYRYAVEMISINADTEDGKEGIASFVEKRKHCPWQGR